MILIGKMENRLLLLSLTVLFIGFIGYIDYITGVEISFSFFYLLPISFLALYRGTKIYSIVLSASTAAILWLIAEYLGREHSFIYCIIWNAFVRLIIFTSIGLLIYYLKEKNTKLNSLNSNLKTINEEKNKFIGIAAHDIRSPLAIIYSFSDILIEDYNEQLNPEILEILDIIKNTSSNSLTILENLLDISKIESGKLVLNFKTQNYISFVKYQISMNQLLAKNKDILITLESEIESVFVDFDEHYFNDVLNNLLSNAIKYSNRNTKIIVKISLINNNQVQTAVIDNGIGITEMEQQNLFKYFQTTSSLPTEGEKSTGLGLAISKQIINSHHGTIGVKSTKNKGSNFFFQIPLKQHSHTSR